eukprot:CAMPEP_0171234966 /NCGR_PEP_ID=MMETSP0790-20130122/41705_1 /TAXON_ID=2925 /ORGANISM="Alexandrium catenella, Strain OF101" /LENGTH=30 /DNA_ID= /DNA_START= /DNA_END= /DNA_ORIENTATION=
MICTALPDTGGADSAMPLGRHHWNAEGFYV